MMLDSSSFGDRMLDKWVELRYGSHMGDEYTDEDFWTELKVYLTLFGPIVLGAVTAWWIGGVVFALIVLGWFFWPSIKVLWHYWTYKD
jgi:hypothetical protein